MTPSVKYTQDVYFPATCLCTFLIVDSRRNSKLRHQQCFPINWLSYVQMKPVIPVSFQPCFYSCLKVASPWSELMSGGSRGANVTRGTVVNNETAVLSNQRETIKSRREDASFFFAWAEKGCQAKNPAGRLTDTTLDEDQWYFLSVSESFGVVVSFVFLFKTSRVRTPETSEDYCKLSSGDVFWGWGGGGGGGGGGRYEGPP